MYDEAPFGALLLSTHYPLHQLIVSTKITQRNWRWFKMNHIRANGTLYSYRYTVN